VSPLQWEWRGSLPYAQAWQEQRERRERIIQGDASEIIWLLEHDPPVITTGKRGVENLPSPQLLATRGIEFYQTERGGLATWHGPGQLMAYLLVGALRRGLGVRGMVCAVENAVIEWLRTRDITADRRKGHPGIWTGGNKICALGLHFRRGVSMHGLALNLCPELSQFDLIVPCGITDAGVTSVEEITGKRLSAYEVAPELGSHLALALSGELTPDRLPH
jgi:lipoate-protein ligase B